MNRGSRRGCAGRTSAAPNEDTSPAEKMSVANSTATRRMQRSLGRRCRRWRSERRVVGSNWQGGLVLSYLRYTGGSFSSSRPLPVMSVDRRPCGTLSDRFSFSRSRFTVLCSHIQSCRGMRWNCGDGSRGFGSSSPAFNERASNDQKYNLPSNREFNCRRRASTIAGVSKNGVKNALMAESG